MVVYLIKSIPLHHIGNNKVFLADKQLIESSSGKSGGFYDIIYRYIFKSILLKKADILVGTKDNLWSQEVFYYERTDKQCRLCGAKLQNEN